MTDIYVYSEPVHNAQYYWALFMYWMHITQAWNIGFVVLQLNLGRTIRSFKKWVAHEVHTEQPAIEYVISLGL